MNLFFFIQQAIFSTKSFYSLKNSVILNSKSIIHIFNKIIQFLNFQSAQSDNFLWMSDHKIFIQNYNNVDIEIHSLTDKRQLMRLYNVVFYKNFAANLMSFKQLHKLSYWWDNRSEFNCIHKTDQNFIIIIILTELHEQNIIKHILNDLIKTTFFNQ